MGAVRGAYGTGWDMPALELVPRPFCCGVPSQSRSCRVAGGQWKACLGIVMVVERVKVVG